MPTTNLLLPFLSAGQAQKHVTVNESLRMLDGIVQLAVKDANLADPPASPSDGDRYIVPAAATGAWTGWTNSVALWTDGAWLRLPPRAGWMAWNLETGTLLAFSGTSWAPFADLAGFVPSGSSIVAKGARGGETRLRTIEHLQSGLSGATVNTGLSIPNGAEVFAVGMRVKTAITGATSFSVGIAGEVGKFGGGLGIAAGSWNRGGIGAQFFYANTPIVLTSAGGNFTGGAVALSIHCVTVDPPV